jgi:hypothetical protein
MHIETTSTAIHAPAAQFSTTIAGGINTKITNALNKFKNIFLSIEKSVENARHMPVMQNTKAGLACKEEKCLTGYDKVRMYRYIKKQGVK